MCQCRYGIKEFMCFFDGYIQYFVDGFVFVFNFQCFMVIVFIFILVVWYVNVWQEVYFYFDYIVVLIGFVVFVMDVKVEMFWCIIMCMGFWYVCKKFVYRCKYVGIGCWVRMWSMINWVLVDIDYFVEMFQFLNIVIWCWFGDGCII